MSGSNNVRNPLEEAVSGAGPDQTDLFAIVGVAEPTTRTGGRGRGRPKGSANLTTRAKVELLRGQLGDPLRVAWAWAVMPLDQMREVLKCTMVEALSQQRLFQDMVLKFAERRTPIDIDVTTREQIILTVEASPMVAELVNGTGVGQGMPEALVVIDAEPVEVPAGDEGADQ